MSIEIAIIDYGAGNLHSIRKALEIAGARVSIIRDPRNLLDAECIVFPGVGAFSRTMQKLSTYSEEIVDRLKDGTPCLGICIGMQILFEGSEEGSVPGLSFIKGRVVRLDGGKIPHMGWNSVLGKDPLLDGVESRYFYFAHSFRAKPREEVVSCTTQYYGEFPSLIKKKNTYGTQFHPEKSSASGLKFLSNFIKFAEDCLDRHSSH